jgi:hypothetical protein
VTGFLDPLASDWMGRVVKEMRLGINSPGSQAPNQYFFGRTPIAPTNRTAFCNNGSLAAARANER